jgi:hypothetical protein
MESHTAHELQEALSPIASLISKSEKALRKLTPGTWQHTMLQNNLRALHHAFALMNEDVANTYFTQDDKHEALQALSSMIGKTEEARAKVSSGTSQYTLLQNRLKALRVAETLIQAEVHANKTSEDF